ncbi:MAG: helix-turn-helix domain-containing protein [Chloroflexota bacterium]|nr:helix-turn-helix domain-containing protein [Chloroflexota bacterium]
MLTVAPCAGLVILGKLDTGDGPQVEAGRGERGGKVAGEEDIPHSRDRDVRLLRLLGAMPFLDRIELSQVAGDANQRVYEEIADLTELGVVAGVSHGSPLLPPARRYYLTRKGVEWLADINGVSEEEALRRYPVSRRWQRLFLERLDAVGVIYRVAASVAIVAGGLAGMEWYRSRALDAVVHLPGDRTLGIVRQGATSDRTGFSKRAWRLGEERGPRTVLVLAPDTVRLRHTRRLMSQFGGLAFVALEEDAARADPEDRIWRTPSGGSWLGLPDVLKRGVWQGRTQPEPPLVELRYPDTVEMPETGLWGPDYLLPALLKPGEKRVLDLLADWPWITAAELEGLLGVSKMRVSQLLSRLVEGRLVERKLAGRRRHLGLSDWGLATLARRDRTAVGRLRRQWSVEMSGGGDDAEWWRRVWGRRSRLLARNLEHTEAVHRFLARMSRQGKGEGYRVVQYDPPHRASRHFRHLGTLRSIHPDAFGMLRWEEEGKEEDVPFFLEWERRAVRPGTMAARLAPYLRYYASQRPLDDHGAWPLALIVFDDALAEANFLGVARRELERSRVDVPLWVSHRELVEDVGPLGKAWRNPDVLEPDYAF